MYTSSALAKKYGLETYLEKPAELNSAIFNLMLLQETIQLEKSRKKKAQEADSNFITVRRIAYGKFTVSCSGDERYRYAVETAVKASTDTISVFQRSRFVRGLKSMGVPEDKVNEFCETITLDDDTHCIDQE